MLHYIHSFSSPTINGWLMKKARTGFRKTWSRCYFILESQQLRCYKSDHQDALPISKFDLCEYQLQNEPTNKPFTFQLIHRSSSKSVSAAPISPLVPSPDLYLQAENEEEWALWMDALNEHQTYADDGQQVDVLNKWLERYDLIVPSTDRFTPSLLSLAPSSSYANDDDESSDESTIASYKKTSTSLHCPTIMDQQLLDVSPPITKKSSSSSSSRFLGFLWSTNTKVKGASPLGAGPQ